MKYQWMTFPMFMFCFIGGSLLRKSIFLGCVFIMIGVIIMFWKWKLQDEYYDAVHAVSETEGKNG